MTGGGVVALGEICDDTENIKWTNFPDKKFKYIDLSSVNREKNVITETKNIDVNSAPSRAQQVIHAGDVIFGTTRPMLKRFCIITPEYDRQICSTGFCILRPKNNLVMSEYVYHHIAAPRFYKYIESTQQGASYPAISDKNVKKYKIPVPPPAEQKHIVSILNKFEAFVNDISIGLPAELSARRKQYEYYRSKLLTFSEYVS